MTHAVNVAIIRYYKVYAEDEECFMTDTEVEQKVREMILDEQDDALCEDEELEIEPDDIVSMQYGYSF